MTGSINGKRNCVCYKKIIFKILIYRLLSHRKETQFSGIGVYCCFSLQMLNYLDRSRADFAFSQGLIRGL